MRAIPALVAWSLSLSAGAARADVAVIARAPEDGEVRRQLAGLLDEPVTERPEREPQSLPAIMREAAGWSEHYVVVVDRAGSSLHVLRPSDQTIASRLLEERVLAEAPYAVALATAELLEWLGVSARAEAVDASGAGTAEPRATPASLDASDAGHEAPLRLDLALGAGLELSASPGFDPELTRLALEAGVELGRGRRPLWGWLSLRAAVLGPGWRAPLAGTAASVERVDYASSSLTLHAALGLGRSAAALTFGPVVGVSFVQVDALDRDGASLGEHTGVSVLAGLALGVRYPLAWGFGLSLGADGQWLVQPTRYRVEGREVLEEGPLQLATRFGVLWESASW